MSTERVNRNFQKFLQSIYHWPTSTIEKAVLIRKLEELCRQNPELEHIYENVPIISYSSSTLNNGTAVQPQSNAVENSLNPGMSSNDNRQSIMNSPQLSSDRRANVKEGDPIPNLILVKGGDLRVKKDSSVLSPLIKKSRLKPTVYCELSYALSEGRKMAYLIIYQTQKCRKMVYTFVIDQTCSFVLHHKKAFNFKHNSVVERFAIEIGLADEWIKSFEEITTTRQNADGPVEDEYENPADIFTASGSSFESILETDTPARPAPRPLLPTNSISPENIYVCLYDHHPLTRNAHELEFNCGDLLYIINTDGPNFYVGHRLILPLNTHGHIPKGLVFKDYIAPAYERSQ